MPSSTSAALNRVIGGNPSSIYGSLSANGILYLINPSGILVGPGGTVNAAAFMASTLDVSTEQFMNAKNGAGMNFYGSSGESIINQGNITAEKGDVFLIAQKVENRGTINAASGTAGMVGSGQGTDVMVHEVGGKGFAIRVAQLQGEAATGSNRDLPDGEELLNEGTISAAQAELNASGNVYALAIRNSGTIRAKAVVANADGTVRLDGGLGDVINTGRMYAKNAGDDAMAAGGKIDIAGQNITASPESIITAAGGEQGGNGGSVKIDSEYTTILQGKVDVAAPSEGAKGGKVQLLGERVGLFDGAKVDASGGAGGGTVLVGGDYLGGQTPRADLKDLAKQEAEPVKNAKATVMADTAEIKADATVNGNGGKVVLWSDNYTGFYGKIFARGGNGSGNGGFVETSAINLKANGIVDASAKNGNGGQWLLDPYDLIIGTTTSGGTTSTPFTATGSTDPAQVSAANINTALNSGTDVTVLTSSGGGTNATGDGIITFAANITKTNGAAATFTVNSVDRITGSSVISSTVGNLNVVMNSVTGNNLAGSITTLNGSVTVNNTGAGDVDFSGLSIATGTGALSISQSAANNIITAGITSARAVSITSQGGDIDLNAGSYILTGASVTINANAGALAIDSGATFLGTTAALSLLGNGGITLDGDLFSNKAISLNSDDGSITVSNRGSITATGGTGNVNLGAGTDIILSGTIDSSLSGGTLTLQANGGSIQDGSGVGVLTPNNTTLTFIQASDGIRFNFGGNATFRAESTDGAGVINIRSSVAGNNLTIADNGIKGGATTVVAGGSLTLGSAGTFQDVGPLVRTTSFQAVAGVGGIIFGNGSTELFPLVQTTGLQQYDSPITLAPGVVLPGPSPTTIPSQNWLQAGAILLGAVDAVAAGEADLGFVGTPDVNLAGLIGGLQPLNNFTTRGGSITFNVATSRATLDPAIAVVGSMSFDSADLIFANSTWLSAGNDLIFGGDITGFRDGEFPVFQVNSGGGNIAFLGSVGNTAIPLGNLDVVSGSLTANSFDVLPPGTTAAGGEISIVGNIVTLPGTAPIIAGGNGNVGLTTYSATKGIVLSGDINTAGGANYDDTMIGGALTLSTPLSDGSTPANIQVESNITTRGGAIDFEGPVFFTAASNLDTTVGNSGGTITFNETTDGSAQATMNSGTAGITFAGNVGFDSNFNLNITGAGGVTFDGSALLGAGANTINSLAGNVVFGNIATPLTSTLNIRNAGTLTMNLGNNSVDFYGEVGGTNPFGITVSSAGGINFEENVTLGGNFNLSSEGTGVNFNGTLNGDHSVTINSTLGNISLGTVGDVIPIAGFSTSSGSGTLTLNGDISTEGGALNFGQEVSVTSDLTIRTGLGLSPLGASISFTKAVLPSGTGIDLTINPGSNGAVIFADGLGSFTTPVPDPGPDPLRFNTFTLEQGGGLTIGGSASGIYTIGDIRILPKVFGSFPKSTVNFNSENGDITLEQGAVLTGLFSGDDNNSDGSNFVAEALNGTLTINGVLDVSGGENDTTSGGGSGYNSGTINIEAKEVVLNTLQALGGDADTVGNGGTGGKITISSEESLSVNSILTDGGTGEKIVGGIGGEVNINRTGAVGETFIGTISSRGGDSTDNFGGNGGNITITAVLGDLYAPTSFFTNGGEGSTDFFAGLGGDVTLQATVGNISFQNQSLTLTGDGGINIIAGKSIVFATSADFTTPSNSSGGVVITSNQGALRADRRGVVTLEYGSENTGGELYMPSSAYLISNGGKVAMDVKNTLGLAGAMTLSGISTSAADLNAGSIEINQDVGSVLGNVTILGSIDANGGDPATTGPRYGRNGGSVLISGLAVSVQQINTSGSASLATATVPAFGGSGGDVTITGTSILMQAGTVPATGSFAINTSGGTGLGTGNANGGSGGNIQLNGNVTLDSGDASKTTIIFNTQGGAFAAGGVNGIGGNITVTGTLTGTETTSNILDLRYGSGTVTLGDATADKITLGTLITAADDARSTGTLVINGLLVVDSLITYARGYSLSILGAGTEFSSLNTFLNTGTVGLGASGAGVTFEGGFNSSAAAFTQLNGLVNTGSAQSLGNGGNMVMGAVILAADSTLNSNGNDITLTTIDNDPDAILAKDLTFASGIGSTGSVTIAGAVGSTTAVDTVTVNSTGPVAFASYFNGGGIVTAAGTTTSFSGGTSIQDALNGITTTGVSSLNGTVTLVNSLYATDTTQVFTLTSSGAFSMPGTVTMSGGPFALAGTGGSFTTAGTLNGSQPLILSGTSTKTFSGSLTVGNGTTAIRGSGTGRATFSGTTTLKGASSFANPVTLSGSSVSASGATVMSDGLTLAGGGGTLGGTGAYTISSISGVGQGLTYSGSGSANLSGVINLGSITGSGSGTMTFGGAVTSANASSFVGLVKLGGDFTTASGTTSFNTIDLTGTSTLVGNLEASGALIGNNQSLTLGAGTQQFLSATGLGALTIQGGTTSFSSGLTGTSLSQTSGTLTLNGSTSFSSAATLAAGTTLNLNGISFSADSVALAGTLNGSGNTIVSGLLTLGTTGDLNSTTTGGLLSLNNGLVLQRNFSMDGAGDYSVFGSITRGGSAQSLTFDGAGTKTLSGNLGTLGGRLGAVTQAVGSGSVSFGGDIFSDGITMDAATLVNGTVEIDSNAATQSYQSITLAGSLNLITSSDAENAVTLGSGGVNGTGDLSVLPTNSAKLEVGGAIANAGTFNVIRSGSIVLGGSSGYLSAAEVNLIRSTGGANFESNAGTLDASGIIVNTSLGLDGETGVQVSNITVNGDLNLVTVGVASFTGDLSTAQSLQISADSIESGGTPGTLSLVSTPRLRSITLSGSGADFSYSPSGNLNLSGRINLNNGDISLSPTGNFVNSFNGNPFTANSTRILTRDLFSSWPSNGAVPGLQVVYGVNSIGQVGANQIGVSTTLLAGNAAPYILEFTTGTGQPYILAQQTAIPPVMLPAALTGGNGFARSVTYSADEIEMMTPEERSAYENQQRQVSARVILQGQSGVGEEIGAPTEGRTPQAATPAALAPVAPTAQVLLEGKPLAGAKSDQERGDATKIIKLRPTRAVALRPSYRAADVMESERMAAEVSVGAAPVAQSR
jgi:filamentous hemagglutinin family protein